MWTVDQLDKFFNVITPFEVFHRQYYGSVLSPCFFKRCFESYLDKVIDLTAKLDERFYNIEFSGKGDPGYTFRKWKDLSDEKIEGLMNFVCSKIDVWDDLKEHMILSYSDSVKVLFYIFYDVHFCSWKMVSGNYSVTLY